MTRHNVIPLVKPPSAEGALFRPRFNDHVGLNRLLAERKLQPKGIVLDARNHDRHKALRESARRTGIATILDTQAMELALPGATSKGHLELSWRGMNFHRPGTFTPGFSDTFLDRIAATVMEGQYSTVLAPAHYLTTAQSPWIPIDADLTSHLRQVLDGAGLQDRRIIYPLAAHHEVFYNPSFRTQLVRRIKDLPVDGISLRIHPFGMASGPSVVRHFVESCWDLRSIDLPLTIERAGFIGTMMYAIGAVDHVELGITLGDSFDASALLRPPVKSSRSGFAPPARVYLQALGSSIDKRVAEQLLSSPQGRRYFACKDVNCCPNGFSDMLRDTQRHSTLARQGQLLELSAAPPAMRPDLFVTSMMTPACDMLARAAHVHAPLKANHLRMLSIKETLRDLLRERQETRPLSKSRSHRLRPPSSIARIASIKPLDSPER